MGAKKFFINLAGTWGIASKLAKNRRVIGAGFPKPEQAGAGNNKGGNTERKSVKKSRS
jgi:hypothetical protein